MLLNVLFDVLGVHVVEKMELKAEWSKLGSGSSLLVPAVTGEGRGDSPAHCYPYMGNLVPCSRVPWCCQNTFQVFVCAGS